MSDYKVNHDLALPASFQFTQSKLQDFRDCPRRFYLKYMENQRWPAPISVPQDQHEQAMKNGQRLHQLIERHHYGLSLDVLKRDIDEPLTRWIDHYEAYLPSLAPYKQSFSETMLTAQLEQYHLAAKFDWIGFDGKQVLAIDWKTGTLPPANRLQARMQTIVYLYVLYQSASSLFGKEIKHFTLRYFSVETTNAQSFDVNARNVTQYEADILAILTQIQTSTFDKTEQERNCRYCVYRGLCGRGTASQDATPSSDDWDNNIFEDLDYSVEF